MRRVLGLGQANAISLMILVSAVVALGLASWYMFLNFIVPQREVVDVATLASRVASTLRVSVLYEDPGDGLYAVQVSRSIAENVLVFVTVVADLGDRYGVVGFSVSVPASPTAAIDNVSAWRNLSYTGASARSVMYVDPEGSSGEYIPLSIRLGDSYVKLYYTTVNATPVLLRIQVDTNSVPAEARNLWLFLAVQVSDKFYVVATQLLHTG